MPLTIETNDVHIINLGDDPLLTMDADPEDQVLVSVDGTMTYAVTRDTRDRDYANDDYHQIPIAIIQFQTPALGENKIRITRSHGGKVLEEVRFDYVVVEPRYCTALAIPQIRATAQ